MTSNYYCATKVVDSVTLTPTCMAQNPQALPANPIPSLNPSRFGETPALTPTILSPNYTCFSLPSKEKEFKLVVKPLSDAWNGTPATPNTLGVLGVRENLINLFKNIKSPTKQQIEQVLMPLFQIIYDTYQLGSAILNPSNTMGLTPMAGKPLCGKLPNALLQEIYKILKVVLPMIDKCADVSDLPNSLANNAGQVLNKCPGDDPYVFICADPTQSPDWLDRCPYLQAEPDKSFFNVATISFIVAILVLLIVVMVLASRK